MRLQGKKILVTGGSGFVGGRLCEKLLLEEGADVRVLVRNWTKAVWISRTTAELVHGDVTDEESVAKATEGCDFVLHCSSGGSDRKTLFQTNVEGTKNIVHAVHDYGVSRLVFVSTIAVHGPNPPVNASALSPFVRTGKAYGDSKIAAEQYLQLEFNNRKTPVVLIRPTFVWGPRSHLFTTGPIRAMKNGNFRFVDNGRGSCHAVHVDNLVESIVLAATKENIEGKAFLITDESNITWKEFFDPLLKLIDAPSPDSISSKSILNQILAPTRDKLDAGVNRLAGNPAPIPKRIVRRSMFELLKMINKQGIPSAWDLKKFARTGALDTSHSREVLGYRPVLTFEQGVAQTIEWLRIQMADELGIERLLPERIHAGVGK